MFHDPIPKWPSDAPVRGEGRLPLTAAEALAAVAGAPVGAAAWVGCFAALLWSLRATATSWPEVVLWGAMSAVLLVVVDAVRLGPWHVTQGRRYTRGSALVLAVCGDDDVRVDALRSSRCPAFAVRCAATASSARVRAAAAAHPLCPAHALAVLSGDPDAAVREAVAGNDRAPDEARVAAFLSL